METLDENVVRRKSSHSRPSPAQSSHCRPLFSAPQLPPQTQTAKHSLQAPLLLNTVPSSTLPVNPLFDDPAGNLVIRSSDGVDSRVKKDRLRYASQVFFDMLEDADGLEPGKKLEDGLPLVKVTEKGTRIGRFLRYALHPQPIDQRGESILTF